MQKRHFQERFIRRRLAGFEAVEDCNPARLHCDWQLRKECMDFELTSQPLVKVGVAEHFVGRAPMRIMTMALGSCLGIVLFDPISCVGALAHAMHPRRELVRNRANSSKFVDTVVELMISRMVRMGADKENIVAKIFGGARMFDSISGAKGVLQIGSENVKSAREALASYSIPIVAEDVGGTRGRKVLIGCEEE